MEYLTTSSGSPISAGADYYVTITYHQAELKIYMGIGDSFTFIPQSTQATAWYPGFVSSPLLIGAWDQSYLLLSKLVMDYCHVYYYAMTEEQARAVWWDSKPG